MFFVAGIIVSTLFPRSTRYYFLFNFSLSYLICLLWGILKLFIFLLEPCIFYMKIFLIFPLLMEYSAMDEHAKQKYFSLIWYSAMYSKMFLTEIHAIPYIRRKLIVLTYTDNIKTEFIMFDLFQPKTDLFSTRALIWVHFKTVRYFSQPIFILFSYKKMHNTI